MTADGQLQTQVFTSAARAIGGDPNRTFSPATSTLVAGDTEAVLIDAQYTESEISALGDTIEQTGKRLTTIYITHGHYDHYYGLGQLVARFPDARPVASAPVVAHINATLDDQAEQFQGFFGDDFAKASVLPQPLAGDLIELEGHELRVIEVGQGDIAPSTVVHVPSIDTVIAGDVVYNRIHMMLALSGPEEWQAWIESIDRIAGLGAKTIVAGHKRPEASDEDIATILDGSRAYIRDFRDAVAASGTAGQVVELMKAKYEDYGNLTTLLFSARAAFPAG
ncbi:MAG TPA: MBL fold metallo-hydrolase [Solirubrobacteraceae bacterium]|nr:MBL fold metallo-hydrolase [Solirubrobacteraceae bacterium]